MTTADETKIKVITSTKQLPAGVDLYAVQAHTPEDAWTKLQIAAKRKSRTLGKTVYQWGSYFYCQLLSSETP